MPFACIFVPDFPVEAVVRAEPELRDHAVAVLDGKPPLVKVFAGNEKARDHGVEPGITKLQVEALPGVVLRPRSPLEEAAAHAALLDAAQSFSPRVEDTAADTVILDLAGMERLLGSAAKIARDLARRASELGLEANVAVAGNPDAAMHAARGYPGVTVIPPGKEAERLGDLPIDVLLGNFGNRESGMGNQRKPKPQDRHQRAQEILGTLNRWGVRNLRTLTALPQVALSERLGQEGLRLQQLARGTSERALVVSQPALAFEEVVEPEYPIALLEPLLFVLHHLLEQLCTRLSARALATNELRLRLELDASCSEETASSPLRHGGTEEIDDLKIDDCQLKNPEPTTNGQPLTSLPRTSTLQINADQHGLNRQSRIVNPHSSVPPCLGGKKIYARALHLPLPMLNPKTFLKLLQLELQAHPPGAPVTRIWLAAEPVCPRAAQSRLFLPVSPEPEKLELTLARIAGVVGDGRSGSPEILDTHHPQGFRMRRFAPAAPRQDVVLPDKPSPVTALRIFRPPLRASVVMHAGAPVRVTSAIQPEVRGEIVWSAGPWRASGDWWKEEAWAREEWDVILQNETGAVLYRMYREAGSGQWYVEGSYD